MRKTFVAAAAALALAVTSLVAAPAMAAPGYEGTVATTTKISASKAAYGKAITATVTVSSGDGVPTGTIVVKRGNITRTATLKNGSATVKLGKPGAGTHTITASYAGDGIWKASSASGKVKVTKAATKVNINKTNLRLKKRPVVRVKSNRAGKVTVTIKKGKFSVKKTVSVKKGKNKNIKLKKLRNSKGKYTITVKFTPKKSKNFKKSSTKTTVRVTK